MSNQTWLYKGKEAKIFNQDELKKAMADGWVDNPAEAEKKDDKKPVGGVGGK